jgi:hypothetical protein
MSRHAAWAVGLALAAAFALGAASTSSAADRAAQTARTIAAVTAVDYRAVVVAQKSSGGLAPTAAVTVRTYERSAGRWQPVGARRLAGPLFWHTVTAPHALCRFEIATVGPVDDRASHVTVQLLRSPSLGCAAAETIPIRS